MTAGKPSKNSLLIALNRDARTFVCLCLMVLALPFAHAVAMQSQPQRAAICSTSGDPASTGHHDVCLCLLNCGCLSHGCSKMTASAPAGATSPRTASSVWSAERLSTHSPLFPGSPAHGISWGRVKALYR